MASSRCSRPDARLEPSRPRPLAATLALALLGLGGCGGDEPTRRVTAEPQVLAGTYAVGQNVRIVSPRGAVVARPGENAGALRATFAPFVEGAEDEDEAKSAMASSVTVVVDDDGNTVIVEASFAAGSPAGLGVDITVDLPPNLAGGFEVQQSDGSVAADLSDAELTYSSVQSASGDVHLTAAGGQLDVAAASGAADITVATWSTSDGMVTLGSGNLIFSVAAGLSGRIDARAGDVQSGQLLGPEPLPAGWTEQEVAANEAHYEFGPDAALQGTVELRTEAAASRIDIVPQ